MRDEGRSDVDVDEGGGYLDSGDDSFRWSQFRHFLHAPLRRPLLVVVPWVAVILLSAVALLVLPKKYMSSALVLVESEKMPESFIPRVATRDPIQRLEAVKPEILSRTRLERVLAETKPYPDLSTTQAVEKMRSSIFIYLSSTDGFTISFYHRDPLKAQEVTDRLARLFIDETIKSRAQQVEGAVDFLVTQVQASRAELEQKDAALRRYKELHMGKLPSQLETNLATMQMYQRELQAVEESLLFSREKQEALARGAGHIGDRSTAATTASGGNAELDELNHQLASLRTRYKDAHPDVENVRARIARLEARLAEARRAGGPAGERPPEGDSSAAVAREQLDRATLEIKNLERRREDLQGRLATIRANVEDTPRTEQELATLTRDYEKLNDNYTALLSKQLEAQMSGRLEQRWKGERFRMLDPASLPEKPVFPKPPVFLGAGAILGLLLGLAAALVAEYLDPTVKDSEVLQAVQGYPVLASIPHLPDLAASPGRLPRFDAEAAGPGQDAPSEEKKWGPSLPGEPTFRDEGIVTPRKVVPIIDTLDDPNSIVGEEMRSFGANLMDLCRRRKVKCLGLTSALPGEGKSTLSVALASALGREPGRRVLLIEADLRRPSLTHTLGLAPAHGLSEWLNGTLDFLPVRTIEPGGFFLVTAGQTSLRRPELLGSLRMDTVLRAARRLFDLVLLDAVPVLPVADTVLMQDLVDGFQLVVRSRRTPRDAIHDTLAKLRPDRVIGVVFNGHQEYKASHKYYGYQRYGMDYGPKTEKSRVSRLLLGLKARL
jgi:succinoglycan biosynthesis transport protein ExoP